MAGKAIHTRSIHILSRICSRTAVLSTGLRNCNVRSSSSPTGDAIDTPSSSSNHNKLRIAVVGGGAAGMTAALHLSPLVAAGLIHGPIDVYESTAVKRIKKQQDVNTNTVTRNNTSSCSGHTESGEHGGKQLLPGSGALGRDIGVGLWSTAWWPFLKSLQLGKQMSAGDANNNDSDSNREIDISLQLQKEKNRQSYQTLLQDLEACGSYVGGVGYRTPNGSWLVKSELNAEPYGINNLLHSENNNAEDATNNKTIDNIDPALLFVREKDLLSCLRNAIKIEQRLGTVKYHSGLRVVGIDNVDGDLGSLALQSTDEHYLQMKMRSPSLSPQYHLIISADGLYSSLRSRFAGHNPAHATAGMTLQQPQNPLEYEYDHTTGQRETTRVEDREYIVFRGNAPKVDMTDEDGSGSFQTWGEQRSMRFAAVPFRHETEDLEDDEDDIHTSKSGGHYSKSHSFMSKQKDEEVWFATISDPSFIQKADVANSSHTAEERKEMLLDAFGKWHKPVKTLIMNTPADHIMYEHAIAHRHNTSPVFDVARILEFEKWQDQMIKDKDTSGKDSKNVKIDVDKIDGDGPMLVFIGDAQMTIDPVLAQGFTMAMEAGASLASSIESSSSANTTYQPDILRKELKNRHYTRERRLLQLLRSTELVQRLAQPQGLGAVVAKIIRPMAMLAPEGLKKKLFDYMLRYSLGLNGKDR